MVTLFVAFTAQTGWLHASAEEIEAEIEIAGVRDVEVEERHGGGAQSRFGTSGPGYRVIHCLTQSRERSPQHRGIDRLF